jgi:FtsP/CotA-like multicopper oxidase with cupredoxin domain
MSEQFLIRRRSLLKAGAAGAGFLAAGGAGLLTAQNLASSLLGSSSVEAASLYIEAFPTSPLILTPFKDELPIPHAARPVPDSMYGSWKTPPGPGVGQQDDLGQTHQVYPGQPYKYDGSPNPVKNYPNPLIYQVKLQVAQHSFTSSQVMAINSAGSPTASWDVTGKIFAPGAVRFLPKTTITGFNGKYDDVNSVAAFPGPRINATYGRPVILRFENHMDDNFNSYERGDFGSPEWGFLTHLHNGHTAPESDGNPHYRANQFMNSDPSKRPLWDYKDPRSRGYLPGQWVDNLYLNYPAGGDDREKQGLFWFHDHFHNNTGANVYKGMVGLFPMYDPQSNINGRIFSDIGETAPNSLGLPGVRHDYGDGSFEMDYDIPLAFYDVRLEDGTTPHKDFHGGSGETHPRWWGQSFFKHFPNHGFVGDIFTVNGTAYPVMHVKRRQYRFRFLDASISRVYEFSLMTSSKGPKAAKDLGYQGDELQGQYRVTDAQVCMNFVQISNGGGLLPNPIQRDKFEIWPAMRREVIVDFTRYKDGTPTKTGDVLYLVNTAKMPDGRMPTSPDPAYKIPMIKIIIDGEPPEQDNSLPVDQLLQRGADAAKAGQASLRQQPDILLNGNPVPVSQLFDSRGNPIPALKAMIDNRRTYTLQRGGDTSTRPGNDANDNEWSINGHPFDETENALDQKGRRSEVTQGVPEVWEIQNGGGGWVHPMHMHMEEHKILMRNGKAAASWQANAMSTDPRHADDTGKDDVVLMDPSESVMFYRNFRTFKGKYVAHCHNLAHEDHAMMFGWEIK